MFEDRSNSGKYDFKKYDKMARTQVLTEEKKSVENESPAHKTLFNYTPEQEKEIKQENVLKHIKTQESLDNLPSSKYLKSFENQIATIEDVEEKTQEPEKETEPEQKLDVETLIDTSVATNTNENVVRNEIEKLTPKPKKNYSFRIKLLAGVYCIVVALFGGWVIGNSIDLAQTNANIYETVTTSEEINQSIIEIVSNINNLNNASSNPEDDTILKRIVTEEITIIPEEVIPPTEYKSQSNWFDVLCNWLFSLFGG